MRPFPPALVLLPTLLCAQAPQPPAPTHRVERLAPHACAIFGRGGNIGLFVGEKDAVLVDAQFGRLVPSLLATVADLTDKPLRFLVNTHAHGDHVDGNAPLAGRVQGILAHARAGRRMAAEQAKAPEAARGGLPTLLLGDRDAPGAARLDVALPGLALQVIHRGAAHTDGDLIVWHPDARVLHMGDLFFLGMLPFVDVRGGGSFDGLVGTVAWLASWVPEDVRIIPGHGPICGRKELLRYRDFLKALQAHARANPGRSNGELAASFPAQDWPEWKPRAEFVTWETLFEAVTGRGPGLVLPK